MCVPLVMLLCSGSFVRRLFCVAAVCCRLPLFLLCLCMLNVAQLLPRSVTSLSTHGSQVEPELKLKKVYFIQACCMLFPLPPPTSSSLLFFLFHFLLLPSLFSFVQGSGGHHPSRRPIANSSGHSECYTTGAHSAPIIALA